MNKENEAALKRLAEFQERGCHMLIPSTQHIQGIDEGFSAIIETVKLSPDPKDKDVYPHDGGNYDNKRLSWKEACGGPNELVRIAKRGLDRLALCAGLIWSPNLSRLERDPNAKKRVQYVAVGGVRKPDGSPHFVQATYWMDLEVELKKLEMQYKNYKDNKEYLISRDLLQKEVNMEKLCESGAKDRVVRELLGVGKPYTLKELELEFVMVRIVPRFDMSDEYTRRRLLDIKLAALSGVYGMGPALLPEQTRPQDVMEVATPIDIEAEKLADPPDDGIPPFTDPNPEPDPGEVVDPQTSLLVDFQNMGAADQEKTLNAMAKSKGYDLKNYLDRCKVTTVRALKPEGRDKLFSFISGLTGKA